MKLMAWAMVGCAFGLAACQSKTLTANQPQFLTQKIYHAPAQAYDFDLGSPLLRGELNLKQTCSVKGSSLDIIDQVQQQVRIDTINLLNHPELGQYAQSNLKTLAPLVLQLYQNQYQAQMQHSKIYSKDAGDVVIARLQASNQPVDVMILKSYNYAYVIQLNTPLKAQNEEIARQRMMTLLESLQIPGKPKGDASTLPISFDLSNSDAKARLTWQKTYCS